MRWLTHPSCLFQFRSCLRTLPAYSAAGTTLANRKHLSAAIRATVRAGMVREPCLFALWANLQLRNFDLVMLAPEALARIGLAFFWQRAHTLLLILIIAQHGRSRRDAAQFPRTLHTSANINVRARPLRLQGAQSDQARQISPNTKPTPDAWRSGLVSGEAHRRAACATSSLLYHRHARTHSPRSEVRRNRRDITPMCGGCWRRIIISCCVPTRAYIRRKYRSLQPHDIPTHARGKCR